MAFLKSSQLSLGPKTVDVKGFTQAETINLGDRAYTEHEVLLADNYNIVGNVTVSDDLIISKLSDDGNAITITGDTTTRTISGSGSIQGATLAQTPNATVTGMSGTLGSGITIGSDATLSSGMMKRVHTAVDSPMVTGNATATPVLNNGSGIQITLSSATSNVLIFANGQVSKTSGHSNVAYDMDILISGGALGSGAVSGNESATDAANKKMVTDITANVPYGEYVGWSFVAYDTAPGSTTPTYNLIRNGTPTIYYTFKNVHMTFFEVFA